MALKIENSPKINTSLHRIPRKNLINGKTIISLFPSLHTYTLVYYIYEPFSCVWVSILGPICGHLSKPRLAIYWKMVPKQRFLTDGPSLLTASLDKGPKMHTLTNGNCHISKRPEADKKSGGFRGLGGLILNTWFASH